MKFQSRKVWDKKGASISLKQELGSDNFGNRMSQDMCRKGKCASILVIYLRPLGLWFLELSSLSLGSLKEEKTWQDGASILDAFGLERMGRPDFLWVTYLYASSEHGTHGHILF